MLVHYELGVEGLQVRYEVHNPSQKELLFSIGGHPAFNVPLEDNLTFEDYYLAFSPMKSRIELLAGIYRYESANTRRDEYQFALDP